MSTTTHGSPVLAGTKELMTAPPMTDWAVVAKVDRLTPEQAGDIGGLLVSIILNDSDPKSHERLMSVEMDDRGRTALTYSLPPQGYAGETALKRVIERGIDITEGGLTAVESASGLILAIRLEHWNRLTETTATGEQIISVAWDRLKAAPDSLTEELLEAHGHSLSLLLPN